MEMIAGYVHANRLVLSAAYTVIFISVVLPFPILLASTEKLSFNFPDLHSIQYTQNLNLMGDAYVSESGVELTSRYKSPGSGWATYNKPLHLWDNATRRAADFASNFSFIIRNVSERYADGIAFFLIHSGATISAVARGGGFALSSTLETNESSPPFIAVEFDTYLNEWDPSYVHVGIDINTVESVATASWRWNRITAGGRVNAMVVYNSSQKILNVKMTDADNASAFSTVHYSNLNLMDILPEWVTFGFSAATNGFNEINTIKSWHFTSSLEMQDPPTPSGKKKNYWRWIVPGVGSFLLLYFVPGFLCYRRHTRKNRGNLSDDGNTIEYIDQELAEVIGPKRFSFREVATATNDFSNDRLLGEGGFGRVYKGYLREGNCEVAIKKITPQSNQGIKEYATEVKIISQLRHRNLVQLVGWCHEKRELLLIYEFMSNSSLDTHLFKGKSLLTWEMRYKIAQGLASALLYLHEEWKHCVLHRDIKASNVMLDSDFAAKLGDFGLARAVDHAKGSQTTILAGTMGYMAPECAYIGKVNKESDIYSFGVVLIEIACGRKITDLINGQIWLVHWLWELYGIGNLLNAVDPKLGGTYDQRKMHCLMVVGLWCVHPDYKHRPTIREALGVLNFDALPPILPSTLPGPTYAEPEVMGPLFDVTSSGNGSRYTTIASSVPSHASFVITS